MITDFNPVGSGTKAAVKKFQAASGLAVGGIVGSAPGVNYFLPKSSQYPANWGRAAWRSQVLLKPGAWRLNALPC